VFCQQQVEATHFTNRLACELQNFKKDFRILQSSRQAEKNEMRHVRCLWFLNFLWSAFFKAEGKNVSPKRAFCQFMQQKTTYQPLCAVTASMNFCGKSFSSELAYAYKENLK
jgi:hypothetical protein